MEVLRYYEPLSFKGIEHQRKGSQEAKLHSGHFSFLTWNDLSGALQKRPQSSQELITLDAIQRQEEVLFW